MANELGNPTIGREFHGEQLSEVLGLVKSRLIDGTYDVLGNHHEDMIEIVSGEHHYEHRLTGPEAEKLERAMWSAGEDNTLSNLLAEVEQGMQLAGFNLAGDHLDITVCLREVPAV